jgi:ADP-ribose pyrophosphatase YjhB (NUDIX family)
VLNPGAPQLVRMSMSVGYLRGDHVSTTRALHSVSVAGVMVNDENKALIVQRRDNQHWEPPGGILELDESIEDGLRREVHEETGLTIEPVALTGVYKNIKRGIIALVFRCRVISGQLELNPEVTAFRWASRDEVLALLDDAFAVRILDALADGHPTMIRQHDGVHLLVTARRFDDQDNLDLRLRYKAPNGAGF